MNEKYVCGICGTEYNTLDLYLDCVSQCGEKLKKEREEAENKKRLEELNAALNGVKQAKEYYEQRLEEFKEKYPEEYKLNFASEGCHGDCKCKSNEKDSPKKIEVKMTNDGKESKIDAKVNGKKVDDDYIKKLFDDPETRYFAKMLGLI